jgi:transcriptional regulator with XRE-family HTH domain
MKKSTILADYLKEKRIASGLSQKDVASKMGYSTPQFISNWERGISQPPINSIKKLCEIYGVESEQLFEHSLSATLEIVTEELRKKFNSAS